MWEGGSRRVGSWVRKDRIGLLLDCVGRDIQMGLGRGPYLWGLVG